MAQMQQAFEAIPARDGGLTRPRLEEALEEMPNHDAAVKGSGLTEVCRLLHIDRRGVQVVLLSLLTSDDGNGRVLSTCFNKKRGVWESSQPHGDFWVKRNRLETLESAGRPSKLEPPPPPLDEPQGRNP